LQRAASSVLAKNNFGKDLSDSQAPLRPYLRWCGRLT
jgi:hypothetical protein